MPTNRELKAAALALAETLGASVVVSGLTNAGLSALVADLRARVGAASSAEPVAPPAGSVDEGEVDAAPEPVAPSPGWGAGAPTAPVKHRVARALSVGERVPSAVVPGSLTMLTRPRARSEHVIASGRSVTSRRGMLHEGAEVRDRDLSIGAFERLVSIGAIVRRDA